MKCSLMLGRVFYSLIFILSGLTHFNSEAVAYAGTFGVPAVLTWAAGLLALVGGASVALGWRARFGATLLIVFLVPVTVVMHRFWGLEDVSTAMQQQIHFLKNLSMLGGALLIAYFGSGPLSLDARRLRRRERVEAVVSPREPAEV